MSKLTDILLKNWDGGASQKLWIAYIGADGRQIGARQSTMPGTIIDSQNLITLPPVTEDKINVTMIIIYDAETGGNHVVRWLYALFNIKSGETCPPLDPPLQ